MHELKFKYKPGDKVYYIDIDAWHHAPYIKLIIKRLYISEIDIRSFPDNVLYSIGDDVNSSRIVGGTGWKHEYELFETYEEAEQARSNMYNVLLAASWNDCQLEKENYPTYDEYVNIEVDKVEYYRSLEKEYEKHTKYKWNNDVNSLSNSYYLEEITVDGFWEFIADVVLYGEFEQFNAYK